MTDGAAGVIEIVVGAVFAVHCPRAAMREWRSGLAEGRHGTYARERQPARFLAVVILTAAAGLMGAAFVVDGIATVAGR